MNKVHGKALKTMSKEELAWLAGFIDGEGWLGIYFASDATPRPSISVTSTCSGVIPKIASMTGVGSVHNVSPKGRQNRKPSYQWSVGSIPEILQLLQQLKPYIFVKKEQTKLLIKYCVDFMNELPDNFDIYYCCSRILNKRGAR